MIRNKAKVNIQIDNELVRITKYLFLPGEETGLHKHDLDYIIVPITNGELLLIDKDGNESKTKLKASESYFRNAGIIHNVINNGTKELIFIETESK